MKISIITVCFNAEKTLLDTIRSIQEQDYENIEYIVIDGGSSDGTVQLANKFSRVITHFMSEPDKGIYDAMNKGLNLASGDVIGVLNADDFYPNPQVISEVVTSFKNNPEVKMVLGNVDFVSESDLYKPIRKYSSFEFKPWKMRFGFMPAHPAAFIKNSAYKQVGSYKLGYKIAADFDMFVRMLIVERLPFIKVDKTYVRMRVGGVSTSGLDSYITTTKEILRSLKENRVYSNYLLVLMRLLIKFAQVLFLRVSGK
jgi:glycosyltransferase involved in cell wall biosynthesis